MKPSQTMRTAQTLYERGLITYMRTDNPRYSAEFVEKCSKYIHDTYGEDYLEHNLNKVILGGKKSKNAQEAHEAIRPTNVNTLPSTIEDAQQKKLYNLIWRNTVASCMTMARGKKIQAQITSPLNEPNSVYKTTEEQIVFLGWKIVYQSMETNEKYRYLDRMREKQRVEYKQIRATPKMANTKQHYTEAKLVQLLEQKGIGRPSTFSSLVQKIQQREYALVENIPGRSMKCTSFLLTQDELIEEDKTVEFNQEKQKMCIKELGERVIEYLIHDNPIHHLFDYSYTSNLENQLDEIAKGRLIWTDVVKECDSLLSDSIKPLQEKAWQKSKDDKIERYGSEDKYREKMREKNEPIGYYKERPVYIRNGKYGDFAQIGDKKNSQTVSLKSLEKPYRMENIISIIENPPLPKGVIRQFSSDISLRKGKYGNYIFYKTKEMTKPKFINVKNYKGDIEHDEKNKVVAWVSEQLGN